MNTTIQRTALTLSLLGTIGAAHATDLFINTPTSNVDSVSVPFGGTLLNSAITAISNPSYNGIARTAVYDSGSGLDFYYQFTSNLSSVNGVERFTGSSFTSLGSSAVRVYQTGTAFGIFAAGTEAADNADRTSLGVLGFSFVPNGASKINPGTTSFTEIIRTNARSYTTGNFALIDGYAANATGFAPIAAAVPEPETYALLLAGLGIIGTVMRRRKSV